MYYKRNNISDKINLKNKINFFMKAKKNRALYLYKDLLKINLFFK